MLFLFFLSLFLFTFLSAGHKFRFFLKFFHKVSFT